MAGAEPAFAPAFEPGAEARVPTHLDDGHRQVATVSTDRFGQSLSTTKTLIPGAPARGSTQARRWRSLR